MLALDLSKIVSDLRLMVSGPRTGFDEIRLPAVQPGSSIMPGKINPSIPEMVNQVCFQVMGCDTTVAIASEHGQLELNVMMPVIAHNVLLSMQILTNAIPLQQFQLLSRRLCLTLQQGGSFASFGRLLRDRPEQSQEGKHGKRWIEQATEVVAELAPVLLRVA